MPLIQGNADPHERMHPQPEDYVRMLKKWGTEVRIPKGTMLSGGNSYYVLSGLCTLNIEDEAGDEIIVVDFTPGRFFGFNMPLLSMFDFTPAYWKKPLPVPDFIAKVVQNSVMIKITRTQFQTVYLADALFRHLVVKSLLQNYQDLFSLVIHSLQLPTMQRVSRYLLSKLPDQAPNTLDDMLTYRDVATHLSIHPVTVGKIFAALKRAGIIQKKGARITILDRARLLDLAHGRASLSYKNSQSS